MSQAGARDRAVGLEDKYLPIEENGMALLTVFSDLFIFFKCFGQGFWNPSKKPVASGNHWSCEPLKAVRRQSWGGEWGHRRWGREGGKLCWSTGRQVEESTIRYHPVSCQNLGGEVNQCACRWDEGWDRVEVGAMRLDPAHL